MGGRCAEEIIFNEKTNGASNDIERATEICRNMVTKWGLSEKLGPLTYGEDEGEVFLGKSVNKQKNVSGETAQLIDTEIRKIVDETYERAEKIIKKNVDKLHLMAKALLKYENIDASQIEDIMAGNEPKEPSGWIDDNGSDDLDADDSDSKPKAKTKAKPKSKPKPKKSASDVEKPAPTGRTKKDDTDDGDNESISKNLGKDDE